MFDLPKKFPKLDKHSPQQFFTRFSLEYLMDNKERERENYLLVTICAKHNISESLISELVRIESQFQGMGRRHGIRDALRDALKKYLRTRNG